MHIAVLPTVVHRPVLLAEHKLVPFSSLEHTARQNGFCLSTVVIMKHPLLIVFLIMPLAHLLIFVYVYTTLVYLNEIVIQLRTTCL